MSQFRGNRPSRRIAVAVSLGLLTPLQPLQFGKAMQKGGNSVLLHTRGKGYSQISQGR
jgi:hypothetical protein